MWPRSEHSQDSPDRDQQHSEIADELRSNLSLGPLTPSKPGEHQNLAMLHMAQELAGNSNTPQGRIISTRAQCAMFGKETDNLICSGLQRQAGLERAETPTPAETEMMYELLSALRTPGLQGRIQLRRWMDQHNQQINARSTRIIAWALLEQARKGSRSRPSGSLPLDADTCREIIKALHSSLPGEPETGARLPDLVKRRELIRELCEMWPLHAARWQTTLSREERCRMLVRGWKLILSTMKGHRESRAPGGALTKGDLISKEPDIGSAIHQARTTLSDLSTELSPDELLWLLERMPGWNDDQYVGMHVEESPSAIMIAARSLREGWHDEIWNRTGLRPDRLEWSTARWINTTQLAPHGNSA